MSDDASFLPIELDSTKAEAVYGVLQIENGGHGNDLGLGVGDAVYLRGETAMEPGTVVILSPPGCVPCTSVGQTDLIGVVVEPGGIAFLEAGLVQTSGACILNVTGTVVARDRLQTSATSGKAQAIVTGYAAFAVALADGMSDGKCWAQLLIPSNFPQTAIDHGSISGLTDDDHYQYQLRSEDGTTPNLLLGRSYSSPSTLEAFAETKVVANAFDGSLATQWAPNDPAGNIAIIDMGAGNRIALTTFDFLSCDTGAHAVTAVKIETSDDGTAYTDHGTISTTVLLPLPSGVVFQTRASFPGAAGRYWKLTLTGYLPRIAELCGYRLFAQTHALYSDDHADVAATAPDDGDALIWNSTSGLWEPGAAGGGGRTFAFFGG